MKGHRTIFKNPDSYLLQLDLPGVKKNDIEISHKKQQLHITTKRNLPNEPLIFGNTPKDEQNFTYHLSSDVDIESTTAALTDGILSIILPRRDATKQITIK